LGIFWSLGECSIGEFFFRFCISVSPCFSVALGVGEGEGEIIAAFDGNRSTWEVLYTFRAYHVYKYRTPNRVLLLVHGERPNCPFSSPRSRGTNFHSFVSPTP
jgi:hypothetical protein